MKEKWFISYSVKCENADNETITEHGIVCATNLCDAVEQIEAFYGPDLIDITHLVYLVDNLLVLPGELMGAIELEA